MSSRYTSLGNMLQEAFDGASVVRIYGGEIVVRYKAQVVSVQVDQGGHTVRIFTYAGKELLVLHGFGHRASFLIAVFVCWLESIQ